jgi:uncharacterized protein (TIGR03435 family)
MQALEQRLRRISRIIVPMRMFSLRMAAFTILFAVALPAQSLTGDWQGTLQVPQAPRGELRVIIKVSTTDADTLKAMLYSIDQGAQGVPASAVSLQGDAVKITLPGMGAVYDGKLSADGKTITGALTQGPAPRPLTLSRATPLTVWAIPEPPARPKPMAADVNPSFEVATIKPSAPDERRRGITVQGRRFITYNTNLTDLMSFAYGVHARQIAGAPAWAESERYDLTGQPDIEGTPNERQWKLMLQKVLAERFGLTFHRAQRELSVYAITVAKTGQKLTKSEGDPNGLPGLGFRGLGAMIATNAAMTDFAQTMQGFVLDRPVVDQTEIAGRYDFTLNWTPDEFQFTGLGVKPPEPADAAALPDLFTAIQQQLGLRLEATKAQTEVLIIDKVEKPSGN